MNNFNQHDKKHYYYARTGKDAFGYELREADFKDYKTVEPNLGDRLVLVFCVILMVEIVFGFIG